MQSCGCIGTFFFYNPTTNGCISLAFFWKDSSDEAAAYCNHNVYFVFFWVHGLDTDVGWAEKMLW